MKKKGMDKAAQNVIKTLASREFSGSARTVSNLTKPLLMPHQPHRLKAKATFEGIFWPAFRRRP
jgi:hypothetical protein